MTPLYLDIGSHRVAAMFHPPVGAAMGMAVLIVPPFGWDDQTSYRARRNWSVALADQGFANLRIDLPGTGDSSGQAEDDHLVTAWVRAVIAGVHWLREAGATRLAVIGMGAGGLVALAAMAGGCAVEDLVLWGMPASGRAMAREVRAFGRLEQAQTGDPEPPKGTEALRAGGHTLTAQTLADLAQFDAATLLGRAAGRRVLMLGRDGSGPEPKLVQAARDAGAEVRTDPGRGWGAALERPQSVSPTSVFASVNAWLSEAATAVSGIAAPSTLRAVELDCGGARIRETPIVFEAAGRELYAVLSEPADRTMHAATAILFNAGAIRRIGPNRMWVETARRWAAAGVPVMRVDLEGIGDASGDESRYFSSDEAFYTADLVEQAAATLDLAASRGLPERFVLGGLCSGAFWAFQVALMDARVKAVAAVNPRMLFFDPRRPGSRELRKLPRLLTLRGLRNAVREPHKAKRISRVLRFAIGSFRGEGTRSTAARLADSLALLQQRGQQLHLAFCGDEPLHEELIREPGLNTLSKLGVRLHELPCRSHTLKPVAAHQAAQAMLDLVVEESFAAALDGGRDAASSPSSLPGPRQDERRSTLPSKRARACR